MTDIKRKIQVIDAICEKHPSYGINNGWSEYTGGMKDSGQWFFRKMVDVPIHILESFLQQIIEEENKPRTPLSEQEIEDSKIIHQLPNGGWINKAQRKALEKQQQESLSSLLYGHQRN